MAINSCTKGKQGEREFAALLREHGFEAKRGQQHAGGKDSPDVISNVAGVHFEVKRVQAGNPYNWLEQATRDAGGEKIPIVAHRRNRQDWIAVLPMKDLLNLLALRGI